MKHAPAPAATFYCRWCGWPMRFDAVVPSAVTTVLEWRVLPRRVKCRCGVVYEIGAAEVK